MKQIDRDWAALFESARDTSARQGHRDVARAHFLIDALADEPTQAALEEAGADMDELWCFAGERLDAEPKQTWWSRWLPRRLTTAMRRVGWAIYSHAAGSNEGRITRLMVLATMAVGPSGFAEQMRSQSGLDVLALRRIESHGTALLAPLMVPRGAARLVLYNDPYTTMEFVIRALEQEVGLPADRAQALMWKVHREGQASVAWSNGNKAALAAQSIREGAESAGFPLRVEVEAG